MRVTSLFTVLEQEPQFYHHCWLRVAVNPSNISSVRLISYDRTYGFQILTSLVLTFFSTHDSVNRWGWIRTVPFILTHLVYKYFLLKRFYSIKNKDRFLNYPSLSSSCFSSSVSPLLPRDPEITNFCAVIVLGVFEIRVCFPLSNLFENGGWSHQNSTISSFFSFLSFPLR